MMQLVSVVAHWSSWCNLCQWAGNWAWNSVHCSLTIFRAALPSSPTFPVLPCAHHIGRIFLSHSRHANAVVPDYTKILRLTLIGWEKIVEGKAQCGGIDWAYQLPPLFSWSRRVLLLRCGTNKDGAVGSDSASGPSLREQLIYWAKLITETQKKPYIRACSFHHTRKKYCDFHCSDMYCFLTKNLVRIHNKSSLLFKLDCSSVWTCNKYGEKLCSWSKSN